jgi:galactokinase
MRELFGISSPELDALVEIATGVPGVIGARLTGAGFGGCTINLVHREAIDALRQAVLAEYPARTGLIPSVFEVEPAHGARRLDA